MTQRGSVVLVGAGPGDPQLLTLAGRDALAQADVVFHDRLIGPEVMDFIPPTAERVPVGKNKGDHPVPQSEINRLLLESALAEKRVVRLKGGDPYLFGRGAEELDLLVRHNVPFRVVPGVTSAIAAPSYAGIPVTHRNFASSLHILTGHGKDGTAPNIPYRELAKLGGTLIFLMGLSSVREICAGLAEAGMASDTPAAAIEKGTRPDGRRVVATIADLPDVVAGARFSSPTVLVVGEVCSLADDFDWTSRLPLWGKRVVCVYSETSMSRLGTLLRQYGATVTDCPAIVRTPRIQPPTFWSGVADYGWVVVTSPFGAELFFQRVREHRIDMRRFSGSRFAAVGTRTGAVVEANGVVPDFTPASSSASDLASGLAGLVRKGERVLLFRARDGDPALAQCLSEAGADVDDVAAYDTDPATGAALAAVERFRDGLVDAVTFTSASGVTAFADAAGDIPWQETASFCIGPVTAAALRARGGTPIVAAEASLEAVASRVVSYFTQEQSEQP
ncbi:MAG: uroporphyrinogen-III C-methyltransferase [Planctomycetaceae bacterium]|nr:uroporphyrinogen-III C-methyltransferase [Planctomycetaceae bacterium]